MNFRKKNGGFQDVVGALRMGSCLMGVEFQFGKMKTSGDSLNNSIARLNCTLKSG